MSKIKIFILDDDLDHCNVFKNQLENSGKGYSIISPADIVTHQKLFDAIKEFFSPEIDTTLKEEKKTIIESFFVLDIDGFILDYELKEDKYQTYNSQKLYANFIENQDKLKTKPVLVMSGLISDNGKRDVKKFNNGLFNHSKNVYMISTKWKSDESLNTFLQECNNLFLSPPKKSTTNENRNSSKKAGIPPEQAEKIYNDK